MPGPWAAITNGYLRLVEPVAARMARAGVSPNALSAIGLVCTVAGGTAFALGWIVAGGWILGVTAVFDVLDGRVARLAATATRFGKFYDSTLDRIADAASFGGLTIFFASDGPYHSVGMVAVCVAAAAGAFVTSYARARAETVNVDVRVGLLQRPERVVLLAAPAGLAGLAWNGAVLRAAVIVLAVASWVTVAQRIAFVRQHLGDER